MRSLSIQGIDERLAVQLRQQAKKARKSLNQFVLDALKKHVGLEQEKKSVREYTDLDGLFGAWSEEEFAAVQGGINTERKIDPELWQ